jgi:hypothetical protein
MATTNSVPALGHFETHGITSNPQLTRADSETSAFTEKGYEKNTEDVEALEARRPGVISEEDETNVGLAAYEESKNMAVIVSFGLRFFSRLIYHTGLAAWRAPVMRQLESCSASITIWLLLTLRPPSRTTVSERGSTCSFCPCSSSPRLCNTSTRRL